jgi:predicted RNase H-like HicB family nuclease
MVIQWSGQDQAYVVTLPEWGGCHTHGKTYEEAAKNGREVLEMLIKDEAATGGELPSPHEFQYPGPSGFTYQFSTTPNLKNRSRFCLKVEDYGVS